ncbi:hypothetical protein EUX98_g8569 [Antrodiella citrinella]|uniref:Uncharacterized protein n=1 Tax=Antrodiella citrinella TaxID=2447956 RepID=A0A4S4M5R2_9APHY|nr:hypothetical protein EUX98_g8569 [Antrodiella citrinella]
MSDQSQSNPFGRKRSRDIDVEAVFGELARVQTSSLSMFRSPAVRDSLLPVNTFEDRLEAVHGKTNPDAGKQKASNTSQADLRTTMASANRTLARIASEALPEQELPKRTAVSGTSARK